MVACTTASRQTSKEMVVMIVDLQMDNLDQNFYQELKDYDYRGDAYYLLGQENEYIELVMYYKQKYVQLIIEFDNDESNLLVDQVFLEYIDLLDEVYVSFDAYSDETPYDLTNKSYDGFFSEMEALSISDIEWILTSLDLM